MITLLVKILIWLDVSVIINYEVTGIVQAKTTTSRIYNNDLTDAVVRDCDGKVINVIEGKFQYKYPRTQIRA